MLGLPIDCSGGELALVAFIFALVYGASFLPRLGDFLGDLFAGRSD